jgi:hypothetical protein
MIRQFPESDWKIFRRLHQVALERFCCQVLEEIHQATANCQADYHERYLEVFRLIKDRDKNMARAFDDMKRSNAFFLLANLIGNQLLMDEEFREFSEETQGAVELILGVRKTN